VRSIAFVRRSRLWLPAGQTPTSIDPLVSAGDGVARTDLAIATDGRGLSILDNRPWGQQR